MAGMAAPSASICIRPSMQSAMTSKESPSVARSVSRLITLVPSMTPRVPPEAEAAVPEAPLPDAAALPELAAPLSEAVLLPQAASPRTSTAARRNAISFFIFLLSFPEFVLYQNKVYSGILARFFIFRNWKTI